MFYTWSTLYFHVHAMHVEFDYHFVCNRVVKKEIQVHFISF